MGSKEKFEALKNRLSILLKDNNDKIEKAEAQLVAYKLGERFEAVASINQFQGSWYIEVDRMLSKSVTPFELASVVEALITQVDAFSRRGEAISRLINNSNCGIIFKNSKEGWISYPAGEKFLDAKLVEKPLSFLKNKPLVEYKKALEHYSSHKWEECAEKIRRTLEDFLREKLPTEKGLDAAIPELGQRLKAVDVPQHLITTLIGVFKLLDKNFNNSSKHRSETFDDKECELLIYQAGLLMTFLNKVAL